MVNYLKKKGTAESSRQFMSDSFDKKFLAKFQIIYNKCFNTQAHSEGPQINQVMIPCNIVANQITDNSNKLQKRFLCDQNMP